MADAVWVSGLLAFLTPFAPARMVSDLWANDRDKVKQAEELIFLGKPVPPELHPEKMWFSRGQEADEHAERDLEPGEIVDVEGRMPDVFMDSGYWVVSSKVAEVLQRFELGHCRLHPIKLYQNDRVTEVPGDFYSWTISGFRSALISEKSEGLSQFVIGFDDRWNMPSISKMKKAKIVVSRDHYKGLSAPDNRRHWITRKEGEALQGHVDIWCDPILFKSLFFSPELGAALVKAGLKKAFHLYPCEMADSSGDGQILRPVC